MLRSSFTSKTCSKSFSASFNQPLNIQQRSFHHKSNFLYSKKQFSSEYDFQRKPAVPQRPHVAPEYCLARASLIGHVLPGSIKKMTSHNHNQYTCFKLITPELHGVASANVFILVLDASLRRWCDMHLASNDLVQVKGELSSTTEFSAYGNAQYCASIVPAKPGDIMFIRSDHGKIHTSEENADEDIDEM